VTVDAVEAAVLAVDDASDPAYAPLAAGAWMGLNSGDGENPPGKDNGGTGFQAWDFSGGFHDPSASAYERLNHFIDGVDFTPSQFNDLGAPAFALANADLPGLDATTNATRPFSVPMKAGDTFSVDFDSPAVYEARTASDFPFAIISFLDASGDTTFLIEAGSSLGFGDFNWRYDDASHDGFDTGISPTTTSDGARLSVTLTNESAGELRINGQEFNIELMADAPAAVKFTLFANTSGDGMGNPSGEREFFFNNLMISDDDQPTLPGDYNGNDRVEQADLDLVLLNWGEAFDRLPAEWVGERPTTGIVDQAELDVVLLNWGDAAATAVVPEPATRFLGMLACVATLTFWRLAKTTP
jgi:hypothetical protein